MLIQIVDDLMGEVRFRRRDCGGWYIVRKDNGRILGWAVRGYRTHAWTGHVSASAFRGSDKNDEGDLLDKVPADLIGDYESPTGYDRLQSPAITTSDSREWATREVLRHLIRNHAPAVSTETDNPHHRVRRWADR